MQVSAMVLLTGSGNTHALGVTQLRVLKAPVVTSFASRTLEPQNPQLMKRLPNLSSQLQPKSKTYVNSGPIKL